MSKKQIAALNQASLKKQQAALAKTEKAIALMVATQEKITVRAVARKAGVSVSYIYKYPELAYKIQILREQQKYNLITTNSSEQKIENKLKYLESKNQQLIAEIQQSTNNKERERGTNSLQTLQQENQQLKQELEFTKQKLQEARSFILSQGYHHW